MSTSPDLGFSGVTTRRSERADPFQCIICLLLQRLHIHFLIWSWYNLNTWFLCHGNIDRISDRVKLEMD
ncbi:hypothetical protein PVAP13_6KG269424 [Panicum virgatum]|uniref:Uncharacterized protein n=1 Tax=Panicum virgatum TaxID=38727 RepID=A0A8T0RDL0_PANVG|nr:hypothetical protein PVAP13_6KG269424 [Panicum virgatum]